MAAVHPDPRPHHAHQARAEVHPAEEDPEALHQRVIALARSTIALVGEGLQQFDDENGEAMIERSVIFIGDTGVGKSTVVSLMAGVQLQAVYNEALARTEIRAVDEEGNIFKIGHDINSQTSIPKKYVDRSLGEGREVSVWDCPGLGDNRGADREIANVFCIQRIFERSQQVKIAVVFDEATLRDRRAVKLMGCVNLLSQVFGENVESIQSSISLVVSRASRELTILQIQNTIKRVIRDLHVDGPQKLLLKALKKDETNPITIFRDPRRANGTFDFNPEALKGEILANIRRLPFTESVPINLSLSDAAKQIAIVSYNEMTAHLRDQVNAFSQSLRNAVRAFAEQYSEAQNLSEEERTEAQRKLEDVLQQLQDAAVAENLINKINRCVDIAGYCGVELDADDIIENIRTLELKDYLEQFVSEHARIPLDVAGDIGNQNESILAVRRALLHMTVLDQTERAEEEHQLALEATAIAEKAERSARIADDMFVSAELHRRVAEKSYETYQMLAVAVFEKVAEAYCSVM